MEDLHESGIVGLGGAAFPVDWKFDAAQRNTVKTMLINGAECEPYVTSDDRMMLDHGEDIRRGIEILKKYVKPENFVFAIENNKPNAIAAMKELFADDPSVSVIALESSYPQGAKQMILYNALGKVVYAGQRFATLLENHPWFNVTALAASSRSAGKTYKSVVEKRWAMKTPIPTSMADMIILDAVADMDEVVSKVDFVFCAVDMKKDEIRALEEAYAKKECPVVSNNSANRGVEDVPMVVPEINADHIEIINAQRKRLGTKRGFIAVKSNCSLQSYVPAIHPLMDLGVTKVLACTYQAISGAGKTFETYPDILDNVIPYIGGEEEKSEQEPMKLWGHIEGDKIVNATTPSITAQCFRVPVSDGHTAAVFVSMEKKVSPEEIIRRWTEFRGPAQELKLPSAPKQFLHYFTEADRPQAKLDRELEHGMAVSIGRLRPDTQYDYKFVCLSHNTLRGAAGGGVLLAELLAKKGYFD
ncbi:aspartate-semialdehyde dehydrogenase [Hominenteromicrobium sp.]|uniref:aspartate-semialdehyde dehydrogenase n=1 Tax=Hominenteromicrobium sp. TaxID=3073581 RepID=UPI003A950172